MRSHIATFLAGAILATAGGAEAQPDASPLVSRVARLERLARIQGQLNLVQGQRINDLVAANASGHGYLLRSWCSDTQVWAATGFMAPNFRDYYRKLALACTLYHP